MKKTLVLSVIPNKILKERFSGNKTVQINNYEEKVKIVDGIVTFESSMKKDVLEDPIYQ